MIKKPIQLLSLISSIFVTSNSLAAYYQTSQEALQEAHQLIQQVQKYKQQLSQAIQERDKIFAQKQSLWQSQPNLTATINQKIKKIKNSKLVLRNSKADLEQEHQSWLREYNTLQNTIWNLDKTPESSKDIDQQISQLTSDAIKIESLEQSGLLQELGDDYYLDNIRNKIASLRNKKSNQKASYNVELSQARKNLEQAILKHEEKVQGINNKKQMTIEWFDTDKQQQLKSLTEQKKSLLNQFKTQQASLGQRESELDRQIIQTRVNKKAALSDLFIAKLMADSLASQEAIERKFRQYKKEKKLLKAQRQAELEKRKASRNLRKLLIQQQKMAHKMGKEEWLHQKSTELVVKLQPIEKQEAKQLRKMIEQVKNEYVQKQKRANTLRQQIALDKQRQQADLHRQQLAQEQLKRELELFANVLIEDSQEKTSNDHLYTTIEQDIDMNRQQVQTFKDTQSPGEQRPLEATSLANSGQNLFSRLKTITQSFVKKNTTKTRSDNVASLTAKATRYSDSDGKNCPKYCSENKR